MNRLLIVAVAAVSMTAAAANAASQLKGHELAAQAKITLAQASGQNPTLESRRSHPLPKTRTSAVRPEPNGENRPL